jgi:hypothetical protein
MLREERATHKYAVKGILITALLMYLVECSKKQKEERLKIKDNKT